MDNMNVKQLVTYLECQPVEEKELLDMEVKIRVPGGNGQYLQVTNPKKIYVEKLPHKEKPCIIIETGIVI